MWVPLSAGCSTPDTPAGGGSDTGSGTTAGSEAPAVASTDPSSDDSPLGSTGGTTGEVPDDGPDPGSSGSDTTAGETATNDCPTTHVCVAAVPEGWTGPVALQAIEVDERAECGGAYSELQPGLSFSALSSGPFECDCECDEGTVACSGTARVRMSGEAPITGYSPCTTINGIGGPAALFSVNVNSGGPLDFDYGQYDYLGHREHGVSVDMVDIDPVGACVPVASERSTPATWGARTIACRTEDVTDVCADSAVCVPRPLAPYEQSVCIWAEGDKACPEAYPDKTVQYREYEDTRDCSACSCGSPNADCEDPNVWVTLENPLGFTIAQRFDAPNPFCELMDPTGYIVPPAPNAVTRVRLNGGDPSFSSPAAPCPPQGGNPIGEATPTDPVTYCCAEP